MAKILNRASVLAVKEETTDGTLIQPGAATDYLALQPDFQITPATEELTNDELKNSLGSSKSIQGTESPTASGSHYFRGSGTDGTAPDFAPILKSAFGSQTEVSTEDDTVSGSTTTVLNVDTGEGGDYERGRPVLVKDATNGYSVRFVHSVSSDALTLNFALDNAPAAGVNLGKSVYWKPANSGHPSNSFHHYLGNSGGIMALAGGKTTSYTISANSGQLANMNYSVEGTWFGFNPIEITSSNKFFDFDEDGATEQSVSITEKTYKDPHELAAALETAMDNSATADITVTYSDSTGKYTIASDGATFNLLWNTGTNTANTIGDTIGFTTTADDSGATSYTSDSALDFSSPQTPSYDSGNDPVAAKAGTILIGDQDDNACFEADSITWTMNTPTAAIGSICADSGVDEVLINSRELTVEVSAALKQYDVDVFKRFRSNTETRFMFALGPKSGSNFVSGKVACGYLPTATIVAATVEDTDGILFINFTLRAFVDSSGNGEAYLGTI